MLSSTLMYQRHGPGKRDLMGDWTSIELLSLGYPCPISIWTHTEDWVPIKLRHTQHFTLLASHLGSSTVRMSPLQIGPLSHHAYDGVVTVI